MESVDAICRKEPKRTQPYVAARIGEEGTQYLIICENESLCKMHTLREAIFTTFAAYYCFNLAYPAEAKHIFSFFQDYILGQPDSGKKTAAYLATVSDIKRNL